MKKSIKIDSAQWNFSKKHRNKGLKKGTNTKNKCWLNNHLNLSKNTFDTYIITVLAFFTKVKILINLKLIVQRLLNILFGMIKAMKILIGVIKTKYIQRVGAA